MPLLSRSRFSSPAHSPQHKCLVPTVTAAPEQETKDLSPVPNLFSIMWAKTSSEPTHGTPVLTQPVFWSSQGNSWTLPILLLYNTRGNYFIAKTSDKRTCGLTTSAEGPRPLNSAQHWDKEGNPGPTECQKSQTSPWARSVEDFYLSLKLLGQQSSTVCASSPRQAGFVGAGLDDPDVPQP